MLRDLRPGATLTVLDKKEVKIGQAVVTNNVSQVPLYTNPMMQTVNISFKYDGRDITFNGANANGFAAEDKSCGLVICENDSALLSEVRMFNKEKQEILANRERDEKIVAWCEEQEARLDPVKQAEANNKQQVDAITKRFEEMFDQMKAENAEIKASNAELKSLLEQALGGNKNKGKE